MHKINLSGKDSCPLQFLASLTVMCSPVTNFSPSAKGVVSTYVTLGPGF